MACDISAEQEEPWRRLLQELSEAGCKEEEEEYVQSRRRWGISAELVWLLPTKPRGEGWRYFIWKPITPSRC